MKKHKEESAYMLALVCCQIKGQKELLPATACLWPNDNWPYKENNGGKKRVWRIQKEQRGDAVKRGKRPVPSMRQGDKHGRCLPEQKRRVRLVQKNNEGSAMAMKSSCLAKRVYWGRPCMGAPRYVWPGT